MNESHGLLSITGKSQSRHQTPYSGNFTLYAWPTSSGRPDMARLWGVKGSSLFKSIDGNAGGFEEFSGR